MAQGLLADRYLNGIPDDSRIARGGFLKKESLTEAALQKIRRLNALAQRRGQTLAEMALAWLRREAAVACVRVGASSVEQLADNLKALRSTAFDAEELQEIDTICNG